ncbi:alpha/beta fold hydrolase [Azorhizobium doebereinerae]|uniref:alpha/beta fold hydrolase n=1 Tax=Azorhizobium doebereinerae TaxID=281091 RepID=UPI00042A7D77|nr:alpha/beta fold hydrolase [Azorhizobium doebereinerae]
MAMQAPKDHAVTLDGLTFRCRTEGAEGAPWLVFSNSLMTDLTLWDAQAAAFAPRFRILRYDQRGHGETGVPQADCTMAQLAGDLLALMDHFGIARAHLVGISMGAATCLGAALRNPERVARLVMADGQAATPPGGAQAWDGRIATAREHGMAGLAEPTLARWFTPAALAARGAGVRHVGAMIAATPLPGFLRAVPALQAFDFRAGLAGLACPALMLAGAADGALPATLRALAAEVPDGRFVEIAGAGHLPNIEQPAAFNAALADFLP